MTETKRIQEEIKNLLNQKLKGEGVSAEKEWSISKESSDDFDRRKDYTPIVDIAVKPFMVNYITPAEKEKIDNAFNLNQELIEKIKAGGKTFENFRYNQNPRCLIAIEIEDSGSRKHLMGDIINASILGKMGIVVPTNNKKYIAFQRIMAYLDFAQKNEKMNGNVFKNIVLIKPEEFMEILK